MNPNLSYKPRPSTGWLWLVLIGVTILVLTNLAPLGTGFDYSNPMIAAVSLLGLVLALGFLGLAILFPQMKYELRGDHLTLLYGPFQVYRIPYSEIRKIEWGDLALSMVSAVRFPGFALFSVPYSDAGVVKMCATSAATRILLIRTADGAYGITPAEEVQFVSALTKRMKKNPL